MDSLSHDFSLFGSAIYYAAPDVRLFYLVSSAGNGFTDGIFNSELINLWL